MASETVHYLVMEMLEGESPLAGTPRTGAASCTAASNPAT
jgi:hypothetical protein